VLRKKTSQIYKSLILKGNLSSVKFVILFIIATQILQFSLNPFGSYVGDSFAYGYGDKLEWSKLSFFGNSLRNWPVVLINLIMHYPIIQILFQTIFSIFSWSFLVWNLQKFIPARYFLLFSFLLCSFILSPHILSWNSVVLSESYSISLITLFFSMLVRNATKSSLLNKITLLFISFLWLSVHPRNFYAGILLLAIFVITHNLRLIKIVKSNKLIFFFSILLFIQLVVVSNNQKNQEYGNEISYNQVLPFYVFSNNPSASSITESLIDVPQMACIFKGNSNDINQLVEYASINCRDSLEWIDSDFWNWYVKFLATHPKLIGTMINSGVIAANSPSAFYSGVLTLIPQSLTSLYFGERNFYLGSSLSKVDPIEVRNLYLVSPVYFWIILYFFILLIKVKLHQRKFECGPVIDVGFTLGQWAILCMLLTPLIIPSELFRLTIQFYAILIPSLLFIVFWGYDKVKMLSKKSLE